MFSLVNEKDPSGATLSLGPATLFITFNNDGTGISKEVYEDTTIMKPAPDKIFTWTLTNKDTYLNITDVKLKTTISLEIITIYENKLAAIDTSFGEAYRWTLVKQRITLK